MFHYTSKYNDEP